MMTLGRKNEGIERDGKRRIRKTRKKWRKWREKVRNTEKESINYFEFVWSLEK